MEYRPFTNVTSENDYILSREQLKVISIIDIITSSLSVLGAGSIIITVLVKCRACLPEVHPIFQLSCADFLASLFLFISGCLFLRQEDIDVNRVCPWLNAFTTALYMTTFILTLLYAVEVFRRMRLRLVGVYSLQGAFDQRPRCRFSGMGVAFFLAWFIPISVAVIYSLIEREANILQTVVPASHICRSCIPVFHYNEDICWVGNSKLRKKNMVGKFMFLIPLSVVIVCNFIFYFLTIYVFRETQLSRGVLGYHQYKEEKRIRNKAILYQSVFIIIWLPTLVLGFVSLSAGFNMKEYMWLYVIQACMCPLQGFCNSIIYGWKRQGFTQALYESTPLTGDNNLPSYSTYSL